MSNNNDWYDNKELFEKINKLSVELEKTQIAIKKYNGLYTKLNTVKQDVDEIKAIEQGKNQFSENIQKWSGWLIAIVTLIVTLIINFG